MKIFEPITDMRYWIIASIVLVLIAATLVLLWYWDTPKMKRKRVFLALRKNQEYVELVSQFNDQQIILKTVVDAEMEIEEHIDNIMSILCYMPPKERKEQENFMDTDLRPKWVRLQKQEGQLKERIDGIADKLTELWNKTAEEMDNERSKKN